MKSFALALLPFVLLVGCARKDETPAAAGERSLRIYTTIAPIYYVTRQLLGDRDMVINTVPAGEDSVTYIPDRSVLTDMLTADLVILNGAGFEEWLEKVSLPDRLFFDSAHVFKDEWLVYEGVVHSHGGQDDHSHEGYNGHTWLAPAYFQRQVRAIYEKLKTVLTEEEQQTRNLSANFDALDARLTALDAQARTVFAPLQGTTLAATHPTYDYLAKSYGFAIFNIDIDPDAEEITGHIQRELDKLRKQRETTNISFLLWEEDPSDVLLEAVAGLQLINIVFPPFDDVDDPDYFTGMSETLEQIAEIIRMAGQDET